MQIDNPLVSIIMTSYNHAKYINAAFESIRTQTYPNWELICVDDGSSDKSLEVIQKWKVKLGEKLIVLTHQGHANLGIVPSHLSALSKARGSFIAYLESDDIWEEDNLNAKLEIFRKNSSIDVVYSKFRPFGVLRGSLYWNIYQHSNTPSLFSKKEIYFFPIFLKRNPVASFSHFIVRKEALDRVPRPKEKELFYDWWCLAHLSQKCLFYRIPKRLVKWRIHKQSANYRRINIEEMRNLYLFIQRLYNSLYLQASFTQINQLTQTHMDIKKTLSVLEKPFWSPEYLGFLLHPISLLRMWFHIVLRKLLLD